MAAPYARLCLSWLAAVTLTYGKVGLADFTADHLNDSQLQRLAARFTVESDGSDDPAAFTPATATARTIDGATITIVIDAQLGSPAAPLTRSQHLKKAYENLAFVGLADRHDLLNHLIDSLPVLNDVGMALNAVLRLRRR